MSGKKAKSKKRQISKTQKQPKKPKIKKIGLAFVSVIILIIIGTITYGLINKKPIKRTHTKTNTSNNKSIKSCFRSPVFPLKYGLKAPFAVDLRQDNENRGLKIMEAKTGRTIKLPGWDKFGYLGLYSLDNKGNIFTSPLPYVSIDINPPKEQNKILIVDGKTGEMKEFMRLPSDNTPTPKNPFGVIGLGFDCTTKSLYATSVAGSSFKNESGKIFQIDPNTKKILDTYDNLDVMGISIFQGKSGKRMYLGLARKPEIYSIGLNETGGFNNDLRFEFSLKDVPGGANLKAHRMKIKNGIMTLKAREFSFTLIAASNSMRTIYTFKYNNNNDKWDFVELHQE